MKAKMTAIFLVSVSLFVAKASLAGNPASNLCEELSGLVMTFEGPHGNPVGICAFGPAMIDDQTLSQHRKGLPRQAITRYLELDGASWGSTITEPEYCTSAGGTVIALEGAGEPPYLRRIDVCQFHDGSMIDTFTLFYGRHSARNFGLNRALH